MKIRTDFVTNSSSSSFIIAYKGLNDIDDETLKKYPFLRLYPEIIRTILKTSDDFETRETKIITNEGDLLDYFLLDYCYSNSSLEEMFKFEPGLKDLYVKLKDYLSKGYIIAFKDISYDDDSLKEIIKSLANNNEYFVILEDD